ncbi:MAG: hypothetical protein HFF73_13705 [Oscillospiraceae bacterium]|nr:hypothetical protein [Oscillospiraceae bacterium]
MGNSWAGLAAAALLAAAFFLPAALSQWGDRRLLDEPHITRQDEEREGFAESLQLSVAEKLFLLRSGSVISVALEDMETAAVYFKNQGGNITLESASLWADGEEGAYELEENERKWNQRLARVRSELRGLQTAGALPYLWDSEDEVTCTAHHQTLYIDQESQLSFLAYDMSLSGPPYAMRVMVDAKTERILSFRLSWSKGQRPDWGFRGSARFGSAWRDYWGMDSVSSAWNSEYIRSLLDMPLEEFLRSGSYNANADIAFTYDGQTLRAPLVNWVYSNSDGVLEWNLV